MLLACCNSNNKDIIKLLLQYNANMEHQNKDGWTALLHACRYSNNKDTIELLIKLGANIEH